MTEPKNEQQRGRADRILGLDPDEQPKVVESQPLSAGLLPPRWWENANVARAPAEVNPVLTVSPQVAQVLNIGIDRVVDITTQLREDYNYTKDRLTLARWNDERIRVFLRNISDRLAEADAGDGPGEPMIDAIVAVRSAIEQFLEEGMP